MEKWLNALTKVVKQAGQIDIKETLTWNLPVYSIEIEYETVKRSKMDMLMKMMLIAFQEGEIESAENLSDLLVVEPIFIESLVKKMQHADLIQKHQKYYRLTERGKAQLARGVFEYARELATIEVLYSPTHLAFLFSEEKAEEAFECEQELEDYRYLDNFHDFDVSSIQKPVLVDAVKNMDVESVEEETQTVVTDVISARSKKISTMPCAEFRLYNETEDRLYVRVWNEGTNKWDETLENELHEKERHKWREKYLENEEKPAKTK